MQKEKEQVFSVFLSSDECFTTKEAGLISFSKRSWNLYCPTDNNGVCSAQKRHTWFHNFDSLLSSLPHLCFYSHQMHPNCRSTNQWVSWVKRSLASLGLHSINNPLCCFSPVKQWPCEGNTCFHKRILASLVLLWCFLPFKSIKNTVWECKQA